MKCTTLAAACLAAGLASAWPEDTQARPVNNRTVTIGPVSTGLDAVWFYYTANDSPLASPSFSGDLGSVAPGSSKQFGTYIPASAMGWGAVGYYTDALLQKHLVVSVDSDFASGITGASFDDSFNPAGGPGAPVYRTNTLTLNAEGTAIGAIADGTPVVWDEAKVIASLEGTDSTSYDYQGLVGTYVLSYAEAFIGDLGYYNLYNASTYANPGIPASSTSGILLAYSNATVVGNITAAVPEPASLALLGVPAMLLLRRRR